MPQEKRTQEQIRTEQQSCAAALREYVENYFSDDDERETELVDLRNGRILGDSLQGLSLRHPVGVAVSGREPRVLQFYQDDQQRIGVRQTTPVKCFNEEAVTKLDMLEKTVSGAELLFRGSKQYKDMKKALKSLKEGFRPLGNDPTREQLQEMRGKLEQLRDAANAYKTHKGDGPYKNAREERRVLAGRAVLAFAEQQLQLLKLTERMPAMSRQQERTGQLLRGDAARHNLEKLWMKHNHQNQKLARNVDVVYDEKYEQTMGYRRDRLPKKLRPVGGSLRKVFQVKGKSDRHFGTVMKEIPEDPAATDLQEELAREPAKLSAERTKILKDKHSRMLKLGKGIAPDSKLGKLYDDVLTDLGSSKTADVLARGILEPYDQVQAKELMAKLTALDLVLRERTTLKDKAPGPLEEKLNSVKDVNTFVKAVAKNIDFNTVVPDVTGGELAKFLEKDGERKVSAQIAGKVKEQEIKNPAPAVQKTAPVKKARKKSVREI